MWLLSAALISLAIGILAQVWKGRTGAVWFFMSILLMGFLDFFSVYSLEVSSPETLQSAVIDRVLWLASVGLGGIVMLLVVATLPVRRD